MSGILLIPGGRWHFDLTDTELPIEVCQFAPRVFQEKLPLEQKCEAKDVDEQNCDRQEDPASIEMEDGRFVWGHELQLVHEPESIGEKKSDGD
jgi:hypothetical protein